MEYTLPLALMDFLPVLFAGVGFLFISRLVSFVLPRQGRIAFLGGCLIVTGGFLTAFWKLLMALSAGTLDITWMQNSLFVFMAPGYILLAWSVWQTVRSVQGKSVFNSWALPLLMILVMFLSAYFFFRTNPKSPAWERVLLSMMVLATALTGVLLIAFAFRLKLYLAGGLFIVNLLTIFLLNGMARLPEQSIRLQWVEEGINTVRWLAFASGAWILFRYARLNFGVDSSRLPQLMKDPK